MEVNKFYFSWIVGFLVAGIPFYGWAQYETANWVFPDYTANFVTENPSFLPSMVDHNEGEYASFSSDSGELLIYTDGSTVWNGNGGIMKNGQNITPYRTRSIIIPKPGGANQFYIFSYNAFNVPGNNNNMYSVIVYAIVDLTLNNGQGEVVKKNQVLFNNMHGTFTISGTCDRSVFWLVSEVDTNLTEGSDKIYIFQIDKDGISGPFISKPLTIGMGSNFRLSPDAGKLLFTVTGNSGSATLLADFKPENLPGDPIENLRWLPATGPGEFSSQSKFVYVVSGNVITQYDIDAGKAVQFYPDTNFLGVPQLAPDGKIYVPVDDEEKLMIINYPDLAGSSCGFNETGLAIPVASFVLPVFASNLFHRGSVSVDAGSDKVICRDEQVLLGSPLNKAASFSWEPVVFLDDPSKVQPVFRYTGTDPEPFSFRYKLTAMIDGCLQSDFTVITITPRPQLPVIEGRRSVCPGAMNVPYWNTSANNAGYSWNVMGGTIYGTADKDTVFIDWGPYASDARVELQIVDTYGCSSDTAVQTIVIDKELHPQMPFGPDSVCVNLPNQHRYEMANAPGSIYTWYVSGGDVEKAEEETAIINWQQSTGKIWVKEIAVTNEAVCTGITDTLHVNLFKDPAAVHIDYVTIDSLDEKRIHLRASTFYTERIKEATVYFRKAGDDIWNAMESVSPAPVIDVSADDFLTDDFVYQFKVNMLNRCDEVVSGNIHNSIRLTAEANEELNSIRLLWNSYDFGRWAASDYELRRSLDDQQSYTPVTTLRADTSKVISASDGFQYLLRIRALSSDGLYTALSNEVKLNFSHELMIPNVITPNEDGFNDTFEIKNIQLYPNNRLIIVNRYGKTVFEQVGYQGGWTAFSESAGVYYFTLIIPEKEKEYKGWLQIIR